MKIYKALFFSMAAVVASSASFAQLLERDNVKSKIAAGTRPEQGDFGFAVGGSIEEFKEMFDKDLNVRGMPLTSIRYYLTDNIELRLKTQSYSKSKSIQGALVNQIGQEDNVDKESFTRFMVSGEYHFASSNLLDTYAGLGLIVGKEQNEILTTDKTNITGDHVTTRMRKNSLATGFDINFGIQAFVSDLPLSIGVEGSIRGLKHSNLQYDNSFVSSIGGVVTEQTYFSVDKESVLRYQSLEYKSFELGADLRIMLTYFFRR